MRMVSPAFIGASPAIREVLRDAETISATDSQVLITGESGVGKAMLARYIHGRSRRCHVPLASINCADISENLLESELFGHVRDALTGAEQDRRGFLETADTGTVLLREVGEMSLRTQEMLLRFLENGEIQRVGSDRPRAVVDVRVIAATNRDLLERVAQGEFREDLYYRLNIIHLMVPPLRDHPEDVPLLFAHYLEEFSRQAGVPVPDVSPATLAALQQHDWPGNVRELKNVVERVLLMRAGQGLTPEDLPLRSPNV